jgi:acetyltransferase
MNAPMQSNPAPGSGLPDPAHPFTAARPATSQPVDVRIRRIAPTDLDLAREFLRSLSRGTRYLRFGRGDFEYTDDQLRGLVESPRPCDDHLIAVVEVDGRETIVGSARYVVADDGASCEFVIVVRDGWGRRGIGRALMQALQACATSRGLLTMTARVLGSNTPMQAFAAGTGFEVDEATADAPIRRVRRRL